MIQKEKEADLSIDELIDIVNFRGKQLKPLVAGAKENGVSQQYSQKFIKQKQLLNMKTLLFKPWSGNEDAPWDGDLIIIKQQIQGQQQKQQDGDCEQCLQKMDNTSQITNMAKHDEIGYFYKFQNSPIRLIKKLLDENGFKYTNTSKNWTIYWSSSIIKMEVYHALMPYQKLNHFPNSFHLTRKDLMNKCVSKMQIKYGISHFNFLPKTYILPLQLPLLLQQINRGGAYTYIVKPHNRSQGKGITVTNSLNTIYSKLEKYSSLIVSHYIQNPLLINGLKFDLRIYVAITGVNPLRIYVYQEGLGRFATETYDESNTDCQNKKYQHLTNYSVNKKNVEFVKSQNENDDYFGSKWSLTALRDFLAFNIGKTETEQLFDRIDDVIVKTILSGQNILYSSFVSNLPYNNSCFQVLGFDILVDSNLKPWLIEVNMSPSMNSDSPIDIKIKGNMIADLLTIVGFSPLAERYLDGNHLKYDVKNFLKPDSKQVELGLIQKFVLKEVKAQNQRRGAWKRVFPSKDKRYKQFFQVDRYFNRLMRDYQLSEEQLQKTHTSVKERQKTSLNKKDLRQNYNSINQRPAPHDRSNYNSVNERRKVDSREKPGNFAIRIQQKRAGKKVFF